MAHDPAALALVGTMFADRYDVIELLGQGGMGAVYRVRDRELDELVALKMIRNELASDTSVVEQFRLEVKLARRVTHANIARTFELGNAGGVLYCTMELVEGQSLTDRLRHDGKLPVADAVAIACAVLDGLAAAHAANVIHRDIKPDNILIADQRVVVADFGVAAMLKAGNGETSGTPAYMAPEQAEGRPPTAAVDVYSVGIVLHEMLTGRRAFTGTQLEILANKLERPNVVAAPGEMPAELAQVVAKATAREIADRYPTAAALRRALEPFARASRPSLAVMHPREPASDDDVATVILIAPRGDDQVIHLGLQLHELIAVALGKQPGVRVVTRASVGDEPHDAVVDIAATDILAVTVRGRVAHELRFAPTIDQLDIAAAATTAAIVGMATRQPPADLAVDELVMRARFLLFSDAGRIEEVVTLLDRAHALQPNDVRIAAALANAHVRAAFFGLTSDARELVAAEELARIAVRDAPDLAESHIAAGHVELHTGDAARAAVHYRKAIACSPHTGEAHEYLGRLLLEAGYVDLGLARLEDAIASSLQLSSSNRSRWDIARAYALEGRWAEHDRLVEEVSALTGGSRSLLKARFGWWRGDCTPTQQLRDEPDYRIFGRAVIEGLLAVFLDGEWDLHRESLIAWACEQVPNRRRRALAPQLIAEAAGFSGDVDTCVAMIDRAVGEGLFDRHWLVRCPLLAAGREEPAFAELHAIVTRRAEGILDAFYGDHAIATSATALSATAIAT